MFHGTNFVYRFLRNWCEHECICVYWKCVYGMRSLRLNSVQTLYGGDEMIVITANAMQETCSHLLFVGERINVQSNECMRTTEQKQHQEKENDFRKLYATQTHTYICGTAHGSQLKHVKYKYTHRKQRASEARRGEARERHTHILPLASTVSQCKRPNIMIRNHKIFRIAWHFFSSVNKFCLFFTASNLKSYIYVYVRINFIIWAYYKKEYTFSSGTFVASTRQTKKKVLYAYLMSCMCWRNLKDCNLKLVVTKIFGGCRVADSYKWNVHSKFLKYMS